MKNNLMQNKILGIFKIFKTICEENDLTYYAIGGTCIGAIRHKGFIPWDDDLDVAMPYEDYLKFIDIARSKLSKKYSLINNMDDRYYFPFYLKLIDNNTTCIENYHKDDVDNYRGVFIDIMPICGISKDKKKANSIKTKMYYFSKINLYLKSKFNSKKTIKEKIIWIFINAVFIFNDSHVIDRKIDKICRNGKICKDNDVLFVWRFPLYGSYKNVFKYNDFSDTIKVKFEDTKISIPTGYDNYLKADFGDYMKMPPKSKRIQHDFAFVDLNKSFEYYKKKGIK